MTTKVLVCSEAMTGKKKGITVQRGANVIKRTFGMLKIENGIVVLKHIDLVNARQGLHAEFLDDGLQFFIIGYLGLMNSLFFSSLGALAS